MKTVQDKIIEKLNLGLIKCDTCKKWWWPIEVQKTTTFSNCCMITLLNHSLNFGKFQYSLHERENLLKYLCKIEKIDENKTR